MSEQVGPHEFSPIAWHDRLRIDGRCRACYFPKSTHPIARAWSVARPLGDTSRLTRRDAVAKELAAIGSKP